MQRRHFLKTGLAAGAASLFSRNYLFCASADSHIEVLMNEPIGTISPEIYGHFAEHLGGVVYDGIWVGEGSKVANLGGIRRALVESLRRIRPAVVRWPGGCFADSYDWRDGTGPRAARPRRTNFWSDGLPQKQFRDAPQKYDPN